MSRLDDVLTGNQANYLIPLYWQRGEDEQTIREEIARIEASGIRAFCVEARPHPDYLGPQWWQDVDIIMEEARARDMQVWMFDDGHFPTGYAAGKVKDMPEALHRLFLQHAHIDALGPQPHASFLIDTFLVDFNPIHPTEIRFKNLMAVVAARRDEATNQLTGEFINVTEHVRDGVLYWPVPEGVWRIFILTTNRHAGSPRHQEFINVLDAKSVKILLDVVYEEHYRRYQEDFGSTFAGFFSDEPGFYNDKDTFDYFSALGKPNLDLLWHETLLEEISAAFGQDITPYLPLLWHDHADLTPAVRYAYMDVVSRLYAENFTQQLGDWCRAHQVEYIGHILEDDGVHTRLGCGAGHYFRALWGQDMSGLDVVLWQLIPGFDQGPFKATAGDLNGEFFHYGLGKLGSSLAHLDPKKKGRALCEVYGAFGWTEGLKMMKWMTDHLISRGVNVFMPHAFSQKEFPDHDCPPHMYARGKNPQYRLYAVLNHYINRLSHLLSGGTHIASAAVLYHAEADWAGEAMPFEAPVRVLTQHQIDSDVVPVDVLLDSASVKNQQLVIHEESYACLVIPTAAALPEKFLHKLLAFAEAGLPLFFIGSLPSSFCEGGCAAELAAQLEKQDSVETIALDTLADVLHSRGFYDVNTTVNEKYLRCFHMQHAGLDAYLFFNEHPFNPVNTQVSLPTTAALVGYDGLSNQTFTLQESLVDGRQQFALELSPYETLLVLHGPNAAQMPVGQPRIQPSALKTTQTLAIPWAVSLATSEEYPVFKTWKTIDKLENLNGADLLPRFSGTFRYSGQFDWDGKEAPQLLDLGEAYESVEVWLNGAALGARIAPPYTFAVAGQLKTGQNELVIEVTNTLVKDQHDFLSRQGVQEPGGLLGPVMFKA